MTDDADAARAGRYSSQFIGERQVAELIGIARGLIADNELNDFEIEFLHRWLSSSSAAQSHPMIGMLVDRIRSMYADGWVDEHERADLTDYLTALTGNDFEVGEVMKATTLPLSCPAPNITFAGKRFCFTGTFSFGRRAACESAVTQYGATCVAHVSWGTDYLVIGDYSTASWTQSSFGRKIETAVELRNSGSPIQIVSEAHWRMFV